MVATKSGKVKKIIKKNLGKAGDFQKKSLKNQEL